MKVDLSIDFDFFIREKPMWDWGHKEGQTFYNFAPLWLIRYSNLNLDIVKETNIDTYADFNPIDIVEALESKGFDLTGVKELGYGDSHVYALYAFKDTEAGVMINIDAHHDMWPIGEYLDCGNWITFLISVELYSSIRLVYPKWLNGSALKSLKMKKGSMSWDMLDGTGLEVNRIYFCKSGSWVPPHHDKIYIAAFQELSKVAKTTKLYGDYNPLDERVVDWDRVEAMREQNKVLLESIIKRR